MRTETDEDLLEFVQFADTDKQIANQATLELTRRYLSMLESYCRKIVQQYPDIGLDGEDLALMAFSRAIEKAHTYSPAVDPEKSTARTFAWLKQIAKNALIDHLRNPKRGQVRLVDALGAQSVNQDDLLDFLIASENSMVTTEFRQQALDAFDRLSDREQFVLIMTIELRFGSPKRDYVARGTAPELASHLGLTPEGVRKIRSRAIKKINANITKMKKL